jgi:hypothetical protein
LNRILSLTAETLRNEHSPLEIWRLRVSNRRAKERSCASKAARLNELTATKLKIDWRSFDHVECSPAGGEIRKIHLRRP